MGTVWTIAIEFQFYLIAPFLFRSVREDGIARFILPLMLLVVVLRVLTLLPDLGSPEKLWSIPYFSIAGRLNQFLFGIALAALLPRISFERHRKVGFCLLAVGLVGMMAISFILNRGGGQYVWHYWRFVHQEIEGLLWAMVIAGYILANPLQSLKRVRKWAAALGTISFSLYLLHWPIVTTAWKILAQQGIRSGATPVLFLIALTLILPVVVALSALSYWAVERPFLTRRRRYVEPAVSG
jgi:peptidoglycan/LPS O-acetylase OafA/YrhL